MANGTKPKSTNPNEQADLSPAKTAATKLPPRSRTKFGIRRILDVVGMDPNFYYRFEPDEPGNISYYKQLGFEPVRWAELGEFGRVGDLSVNQGSQMGEFVTGNSLGIPMVLLKQPMQWRMEDVAEHDRLVARTENALRRKKGEDRADGLEGHVSITDIPTLE